MTQRLAWVVVLVAVAVGAVEAQAPPSEPSKPTVSQAVQRARQHEQSLLKDVEALKVFQDYAQARSLRVLLEQLEITQATAPSQAPAAGEPPAQKPAPAAKAPAGK